MNTVAAHATVFTDSSVRCDGPILAGPTVYEWAKSHRHADPDLAAEAEAMLPWSHPTRRFNGHYLAWAFQHVLDELPSGVRAIVHPHRAVAISETADGRQVLGLEGVPDTLVVDAVVIATGHTPVEPTPDQVELARFAEENGLVYVGAGNPVDLDLTGVRAGERVLLRGLGMNFFDIVSLLTVGRGGRFVRAGDGLRYEPSGAEPVLVPGSRRGVPYHARGSYDAMPPVHKPLFFDDSVVEQLRSRAGTVDFRRDLWPLIAKETAYVYYGMLTSSDDFRRRFARLDWDSEPMRKLIAAAVPDPSARLDFERIDHPLGGESFAGRDALNRRILDHLRTDAAQAKHASASPMKHAMTALGATRSRVRIVAEHGGLRGRSHVDDLDGWFRGFAASVGSGPPVTRIEELLALADAGLLEFGGPGFRITADRERSVFAGSSPQVDGPPVLAAAVVEAYLPEPDLRHTADPLLRQLRDTGVCRPYVLADPAGPVETGGLEVTESPHHIVDAAGRAHPRRFALGLPVEPVHWGTAIGAMARAGADFLVQTDAVARALLTCARERTVR
ncbi:FAD/NAD(P)-binding protein [Flindersiella endophytica]